MPKRAAGITAAAIRHLKPGRYGDGNGLYLFVRSPKAKFWLLRYVSPVTGARREAGLGSAYGDGAITLAEARVKAADWRSTILAGRDPLVEREAGKAATKAAAMEAEVKGKTFRDVVALYLAAHEAGWRNPKHRMQWGNTLRDYAYLHMGDLPVGDVDTGHVMAALEPIWREKPETASRVRGRIESVLDYAKARGWRDGDNPARWRGHVANMLPKRSKVARVEHHAALPWREIPAFMGRLREQDGLGARALELTVLTAARTSETLNARWSELDMEAGIWTVPGSRMKAGREHRVPLSDAALVLLRDLLPLRDRERGDWLFPGAREGRPLSNMAMLMLLRRMGLGELTAHGFRSSFRDWCAESTSYPGELAEAALAHTVKDKVEAAYRRGDLFEKRRRLMQDWSEFCTRPPIAADVVPIRAIR